MYMYILTENAMACNTRRQ